jgi:hypothetical protein
MRLSLIALMCVALTACGLSNTSDPYNDTLMAADETPWSGSLAWMLDPGMPVTPAARSVNLLVAIPTCGTHGTMTPVVVSRSSQVAIEMRLDNVGDCLQAGGPVKFVLDLSEPVGNREIVALMPVPRWPYRSSDDWGRIPYWSEVADSAASSYR